jgi:hypothetical protein
VRELLPGQRTQRQELTVLPSTVAPQTERHRRHDVVNAPNMQPAIFANLDHTCDLVSTREAVPTGQCDDGPDPQSDPLCSLPQCRPARPRNTAVAAAHTDRGPIHRGPARRSVTRRPGYSSRLVTRDYGRRRLDLRLTCAERSVRGRSNGGTTVFWLDVPGRRRWCGRRTESSRRRRNLSLSPAGFGPRGGTGSCRWWVR